MTVDSKSGWSWVCNDQSLSSHGAELYESGHWAGAGPGEWRKGGPWICGKRSHLVGLVVNGKQMRWPCDMLLIHVVGHYPWDFTVARMPSHQVTSKPTEPQDVKATGGIGRIAVAMVCWSFFVSWRCW